MDPRLEHLAAIMHRQADRCARRQAGQRVGGPSAADLIFIDSLATLFSPQELAADRRFAAAFAQWRALVQRLAALERAGRLRPRNARLAFGPGRLAQPPPVFRTPRPKARVEPCPNRNPRAAFEPQEPSVRGLAINLASPVSRQAP